MQVEITLLNNLEEIFEREFRALKPRTPVPDIAVIFRQFANANSRIRLESNKLTVEISDIFKPAPTEIQQALAHILIAKLYRKYTDPVLLASYRSYLNRTDVRSNIHHAKRQRGRKNMRGAEGRHFNLNTLFDELNEEYFAGTLDKPALGWSVRTSRTVLGHYDPAHHAIVLSALLDTGELPDLVVRYVMFHEMLHLKHPTEHREKRRCVHTRDFKEAEKGFRGYSEAQAQLKRFVTESCRQARKAGTRPAA